MSPNIWTQCEPKFSPTPISSRPWRVVEAQHVNSTRKLVDSDDEQELLEALIDTVKPPRPKGLSESGLHYLLWTPFRHPPLKYGSRFGTRLEEGIWYGAESQRTAFSERAYYRLLFLEGTEASLGLLTQMLTVFQAQVKTARGTDLTEPPFDAHERLISSPASYEHSQPLGTALRAQQVEVIRFRSARDAQGGTNLGLFVPAFASKQPMNEQSWRCTATTDRVEFMPLVASSSRVRAQFEREAFEVGGKLPTPGIG